MQGLLFAATMTDSWYVLGIHSVCLLCIFMHMSQIIVAKYRKKPHFANHTKLFKVMHA